MELLHQSRWQDVGFSFFQPSMPFVLAENGLGHDLTAGGFEPPRDLSEELLLIFFDGEAVVAVLGGDEKLRELSLRIQSVAGHHSASQIHGFDEVDRLSDLVLFFLDQNLLDTQL